MKGLEIWKNFNQSAKLIVIVLVGLLAATAAYSFFQDNAMDRWREGYEAYRDSAQAALEWGREQAAKADSALMEKDSVKAVVDSLATENEVIRARTNAINRRNRRLAEQNDSLFSEVAAGATTVEEALANTPEVTHPWVNLAFSLYQENSGLKDEIDQWKLQVNNLELQNSGLNDALVLAENAVVFQKERADSLDAILVALPEGPPKETFLGFIPLPSRKASLVIGFIGGVVVTSVIVSQI